MFYEQVETLKTLKKISIFLQYEKCILKIQSNYP